MTSKRHYQWENMINSAWRWLDPEQIYYTPAPSVKGISYDDGNTHWFREDKFEFEPAKQFFDFEEGSGYSPKNSVPKKFVKESDSEWTSSGQFHYAFLREQYDQWCNVEGWNDEWGKLGGGYDDYEQLNPPTQDQCCNAEGWNDEWGKLGGGYDDNEQLNPPTQDENWFQPSYSGSYYLPEEAGAELYGNFLTDPWCSDVYDWPSGQVSGFGWEHGVRQNWSSQAVLDRLDSNWESRHYEEYRQRQSADFSHFSSDYTLQENSAGSLRRNQNDKNGNAVDGGVEVIKDGEKTETAHPRKKKKKTKRKKRNQSNQEPRKNESDLSYEEWFKQVANRYEWDRWARSELLYYHADLYWQGLPSQYEQLYYEDSLLRKEEEEFWYWHGINAGSSSHGFYTQHDRKKKGCMKRDPSTNAGCGGHRVNHKFGSRNIDSSSALNM